MNIGVKRNKEEKRNVERRENTLLQESGDCPHLLCLTACHEATNLTLPPPYQLTSKAEVSLLLSLL